MSSEVVLKVENVGKCYEIYEAPHHRLLQTLLRGRQQFYKEFWALKNVTFEVKKGEGLGIIGRNGCGKSTLLQIISGTLAPTLGRVSVAGKVAALLELGSGFNPEFTGRENVCMNAAVLGLTRVQIDARFDDIAAFADIGQFIEQPVKTYSSGMYVRLAFAVIAHVDADILVVDEALAVGDAIFTQKCMRFIRRFQEKGTLIFVSHDTPSVQNLCKSCIWLQDGCIERVGTAKNISEAYLQYTQQAVYGDTVRLTSIAGTKVEKNADISEQNIEETIEKDTEVSFFSQLNDSAGWGTGKAEILSVNLLKTNGQFSPMLCGGEVINVEIIAKVNRRIDSPILGWFVKDRLGQMLFGGHTYTNDNPPMSVNAGEKLKGVFQFQMPLLPNGEYAMTVSIAEGDPFEHIQHHWLHDALILKISSSKLRYGLVGVPFRKVHLTVVD
jgi:lipopolysaccharide transport system ATP-binding protein